MLFHDMTNDYRQREYRITITLQEGYYKGELYYDYIWSGATGHGLHFEFIERIYRYLTNLSYIDDSDWQEPRGEGGFDMGNNCSFKIDSDNQHVHFILKDYNGNLLEKTISKYDLELYIIGVSMISCIGRGIKRDSRKCGICRNFGRVENAASGMCKLKKRKVSQGTTICKYGFVETDY